MVDLVWFPTGAARPERGDGGLRSRDHRFAITISGAGASAPLVGLAWAHGLAQARALQASAVGGAARVLLVTGERDTARRIAGLEPYCEVMCAVLPLCLPETPYAFCRLRLRRFSDSLHSCHPS